MTKQEFLKELSLELSGLSAADTKSSLEYYGEMIAERTDSGMSEEAAVAELGTPREIAREIMLELPIGKVIKSKIKKKRSLNGAQIAAIIIGSPIWVSLLAVALALVITVYAVIWSVFISILAVDLGAVAGGGAIFVASLFNIMNAPANSTLLIGLGLCAIGMGAFCFLPCLKLCKLFVKTTVVFTKAVKIMIVGKEK